MVDFSDHIIRREVKSWAEQQQPRETGRARLLLLASSRKAVRESTSIDMDQKKYHPKIRNEYSPPSVERFLDPMNQSYIWFIRMSVTPLENLS